MPVHNDSAAPVQESNAISENPGLGYDQIVMSFAEHTDDKVALCDIALERLSYDGLRSRALLIDNRLDLVDAWRDSGGAGY